MSVSSPVVVLAGGLGTRLRDAVPDCPKILAPVAGKPFIEILLAWLVEQEVKQVIFSLGYKADFVISHLDRIKHAYDLTIETIEEPEPLGTLGALSYVFNQQEVKQAVLSEAIVINGDTWVDVNLKAFINHNHDKNVSLVCHQVSNLARYGALTINRAGEVLAFIEKDINNTKQGWINAGIYWFNQHAIAQISTYKQGSLEHEFLADPSTVIQAFASNGKGFIDIGTPESLSRAKDILKEYLS